MRYIRRKLKYASRPSAHNLPDDKKKLGHNAQEHGRCLSFFCKAVHGSKNTTPGSCQIVKLIWKSDGSFRVCQLTRPRPDTTREQTVWLFLKAWHQPTTGGFSTGASLYELAAVVFGCRCSCLRALVRCSNSSPCCAPFPKYHTISTPWPTFAWSCVCVWCAELYVRIRSGSNKKERYLSHLCSAAFPRPSSRNFFL